MNNCGAGAEKVCRFVSTRLPRKLAMTKFFICARKYITYTTSQQNHEHKHNDETRIVKLQFEMQILLLQRSVKPQRDAFARHYEPRHLAEYLEKGV